MKKWCAIILLFFSLSSRGQIITTWAGNGSGGGSDGLGDGLNKSAGKFNNPAIAIVDKYSIYIPDGLGYRIHKVDTSCIISCIAGTGTAGYNGDSILAVNAQVNQVSKVLEDSVGNLYYNDAGNFIVRKIDHVTGIVMNIAGTGGVSGFSGDSGLAVNAKLKAVSDICFDKWYNLYIADGGNKRVRKIDHTTGIITTIAGNGNLGYSGDGSKADTATVSGVIGICADTTGNLYLAAESLSRVFKINTLGIITTIAGNASGYLYNGDNIPATSAQIDPWKVQISPSGFLYIVDGVNNRVRMINASGYIHTVAGDGSNTYGGDNHLADSAGLSNPGAIAFDYCGNLYVSQSATNARVVRKVALNPSCPDTLCGPHIDTTTSIGQVNTNTNIYIYPNPANTFLHIDNVNSTISYCLFNMLGITMQTGSLKQGNNSIDISHLPYGIYMLQLQNENFEKVEKIVKE